MIAKIQTKEIEVSLSENHLRRVSKCDPVHALVELIWNGLDAGATRVEVTIKENDIGGITETHVKDNGSGIASDALSTAFGSLGESLKTQQKTNSRGRRVHGSLLTSTVGMYGDVQGIVGASLPKIASLELEAPGCDKKGDEQ